MPLLNLPNETLLQIAKYPIPRYLSPFLRANKRLYFLLQQTLQNVACKKIYAYAALYCAAARRGEPTVRFLLQRNIDINVVNEHSDLYMDYRAHKLPASGLSGKGPEDMVILVLEKGVNLMLQDDYDPRSCTRTDEDEIIDGSSYNCPTFAESSEFHGDYVNPALESYATGNPYKTALHWAIIHKHRPLLNLVLEKGADLDYQDSGSHETTLHEAAF